MANPTRAAEYLRSVLKKELVEKIQWNSLKVEPGSFISEELSPLYTDLLYSVRLVGEPEKTVLLYVLLEHQSSTEPWMLLRLLGYMVNIWTLWTTKNPKAKTLPYLLPVVLSNTEGGWKPRTTFQSLFESGLFFDLLTEHIPEFSVLVDDLMIQEDAQIKKRVQESFLALTLLLLRNGRARKNLAQWLKSEGASELRLAIADLCEVLGIELTAERTRQLNQLDLAGLGQLRVAIKANRAWPDSSVS